MGSIDPTALRRLFDRAVALPAADRAAFLSHACPDNQDLRAEVERLLAAAEADESIFHTGERLRQTIRWRPGERIGPYEILGLVGAGGMGEVYRARDTRLHRTVALKMLRLEMSGDAGSRTRFEREARAVAALNDSHICALYDIGREGGVDFLVLEYLEGETLADRLAKGPLPLRQALTIAIDIANALAIAHRHGVIHRDLKPGNVMLTKGGTKLLDFGLARLRTETPHGDADQTALMQTMALTSEGTLLGTLPYMAPEQVEGKQADARTDIFAFGAVLYEMVTGRRAFSGATPAALIAAILSGEPPPITMPPTASSLLDDVIRRCLAKDPADRCQSAQDVAAELHWILSERETELPQKKRLDRFILWVATSISLLLAAGGLVAMFRRVPADARMIRFTIAPTDSTALQPNEPPAVSPDGRQVVYVASAANKPPRLWIHRFDSMAPRSLEGTDRAASPFWSPDGVWIGFFADGKLKRIPAVGGISESLCDVVNDQPFGADWNRDGVIIFTPREESALYRLAPTEHSATALTTLDKNRQEQGHYSPHFLPDGRHFLFVGDYARPEDDGLYVGSLDSTERRRLVQGLSNAAYVDPGYLVYVREQTLVAQRFDEKKLQLLGEPRAIAEGVALFPGRTGALFSASRQGVLAYRTDPLPLFQLTWFSRSGAVLSTVGPPGAWDFAPVLSPNERSIAIVKHGMDQDIWLIDAARGATTPFTSEPSWDITPTWSPDGQDIIFSSDRAGPFNLFRQRVGATGTSEMILATSISKFAEDWSADGRYLLYQAIDPETKLDVWALSLKDGVQIPLVHTNFSEYGPKLSRDGRWLAYVSEESGRAEVYVQSFQGAMGRWQISTSGGTQPLWRADGRELTFVSPDGTVNAVAVEPHDSVLRISEPHPLFRSPLRPSVAHHYALAADGQKLLIPVPVEPSATQPISVIINWPAGLSSRNEP